MTRFLITGAAGFVGTSLRHALDERHGRDSVVALGVPDQNEGPRGGHDLDDRDLVVADLLDQTALHAAVARARPDVIVHLAAQSSVSRTAQDSEATYATNLGGSLNLALAVARHAPDATILFASTSEVYGAAFLTGLVTESTPPLPLNAYARSKLLAEQALAAVLPDTARLIVARPVNHTGPGQREDFVLPSFAAQIARIEAGRQATLSVGNLDVRRDILDVRDVVVAYVAMIERRASLPRRLTCNIASGMTSRLLDHVETMMGMSTVEIELTVDPARLRRMDVPETRADATLLRSLIDWAPRCSINKTLRDLLEYARLTARTGTS